MKSMSLIALLFSLTNANAAEKVCYPFAANEYGYEKICVETFSDAYDSDAKITITKADAVFAEFKGKRKFTEAHTAPVGKEHDLKYFPASLDVSGSGKGSAVEFDVALNIFIETNYPNRCQYGSVRLTFQSGDQRYGDLKVLCPKSPYSKLP